MSSDLKLKVSIKELKAPSDVRNDYVRNFSVRFTQMDQ